MMHSITYQGHQVKFFSEGTGERIILLHGWPTNSRLWQSQVAVLQEQYGVITPDWLGFGQSDKPANFTYTFTAMKEVLDEILSNVLKPGEQITIVAHDIGGPPAVLWASENEERVRQLILLNTVVYPFKTKLDAFSEVLLHLPVTKELFVSPLGLKLVMKTNTRSGDKAVNQRIGEVLSAYAGVSSVVKRNTLTGPLEEGRRNEIHTIAGKFRNLRTKKHLIIARQDPLCYAHIRKLNEENPEVPVHFIDNCGHFIPVDRPRELNDILLSILGQ